MDLQVSEQASSMDGDVPSVDMTGQTTVSVLPQEATGTAKTQKTANEENKDWRKSDKDWQQMVEASRRGQDAADQLAKLKTAFNIDDKKSDEPVDLVKVLSQKVESLEMAASRAKWEKENPAVDLPENREKWAEAIKKKGHLVKSGDLSYDDLWAMTRKDTRPSTSKRDLQDQELSIGSVPPSSKSSATGSEIDPDVYAAMKKAGYTDEQIRMSAP